MLAPDIPQTLGALLVGGLFAAILTGVVNLQTLFYFRTYQKDPLPVKVLVSRAHYVPEASTSKPLQILTVWVLDNLHTAFIWGGLWTCLVEKYGERDMVDSIPWHPLITCTKAVDIGLTIFSLQLSSHFFAHRIFLLSKKNWFMMFPILALTLLRLVASCISTREMFRYRSFDMFRLKAGVRNLC
ncbi:hypothetical protein K438DRAFT_1748641 [Mycena galopus ATCC 62051]|nr:hypothetical protein K438DRAFT_1748641 [Mycena galopus ATCC 62051]